MTTPADNSHRPRVLIINDDDAVLRAQVRTLTDEGYAAATAGSGEAAMKAIRETAFDAIVSEIDTRGTDGLELLERVRDQEVPVILITRNPSTDTAIKAIERGALRYLIEPVDLGELVSVVGDAVRLHGIAKERRQLLGPAGVRAGTTSSVVR